jgi:hypothetical protein
MSLVVGVTMPPVVMVEIRPFQAGKGNEFALRVRIFRIAENFTVIEDHRFDGHEISCEIIDLDFIVPKVVVVLLLAPPPRGIFITSLLLAVSITATFPPCSSETNIFFTAGA